MQADSSYRNSAPCNHTNRILWDASLAHGRSEDP
jgi:hypothetical protein